MCAKGLSSLLACFALVSAPSACVTPNSGPEPQAAAPSTPALEKNPASAQAAKGLVVTWTGYEKSGSGDALSFRVDNQSAQRLYVASIYSLSDPCSRVLLLRDGDWRDISLWGCGAGFRWSPIEPGGSTCFTRCVDLFENPELLPMKVDVCYLESGGDPMQLEQWRVASTGAFKPDHLYVFSPVVSDPK